MVCFERLCGSFLLIMLIVGHFFDFQINITLKLGLLFVVIQWLKVTIFLMLQPFKHSQLFKGGLQ